MTVRRLSTSIASRTATSALGAESIVASGRTLRRIELQVCLREWHRRIPEYLIPDEAELEYTPLLRQVEHLPLVFSPIVR